MRSKMVFVGVVALLISAMIVGIVGAASSGDLLEKQGISGEQFEKIDIGAGIVIVSTVTPSEDELLGKYEKSNLTFRRIEDNKLIKYLHRYRTIDGLLVKWDYRDYIFDKKTGDLILKEVRWRDDLPEHVPEKIISKEEAESIAKSVGKGKIMNTNYAHTHLCFISSQAEFPIKPMPKNPCWIVYFADENGYNIDVIVVDAVEGTILGHGVPFPSSGFSFSGPQDVPNCTGNWTDMYQNAESWFETMGYPTEAVVYPNEAKVQSHIQSYETAMFYEAAHGDWFTGFQNDCSDKITPGEIRAWIKDYTKMPFTFIYSCGGMCYTGWPSLSDAFRKGSAENTASVGYCGMGSVNYPFGWGSSKIFNTFIKNVLIMLYQQ